MALHVDSLLDRLQLKSKLRFWRIAALLLLIICVGVTSVGTKNIGGKMQNHIARVKIEGMIVEDQKQYDLLEELAEDNRVKAVILSIDSPGGTASGGEALFIALRELAAKKPIVATMHGMATSGGYMAALGADRIYARQGTITGSIGVILQTAEFTEMAKKLGIEPITVKSGEFKATPSFAEKFTAEQRASIQAVIDSFHGYFKTITAERRGLSPAAVDKISQGQVYSGAQAVELKLVDALGGEKEAIAWLETEKKLAKELPVLDAEVEEEPKSLLEKISTFASSKGMGDVLWRQRGLMAHWQ